ncbi:septal ring lytic transglycosylase RlpA family protein [Azoarcus indigens]|uniref:Endolytic peptidoglycan transglycosylase RlpA n=1 Tax=Azoarcus indigens TaxID=29545 RepID=A0A4R6DPP6_9RHOO|nr:septal ring lytic transglycosylase RlpA family protein [Azoarcus indigens]NMG66827.1 septal ring lytic transglycosylase RlpA family protein [Azoarcus indigens]TDN46995.1 rare lipoprotein A [Azoarcus indigens]
MTTLRPSAALVAGARRNAAFRSASPLSLLCAATACALLSACGSTPTRAPDSTASGSGGPRGEAPATPPKATTRRGGGYYKDDGPDDIPPDNLELIPDAQPKLEPLHRFANRPYNVFGQNYVPATVLAPYRERGVASWYGRRFHGQATSSGEPYDMYAMTAAHPTLPIPSYARVTNVATGRSVVVRINDRGPFHKGRVMDLSYTAAYKLGYVNSGSTEVEVEQILPGELPMYADTDPVPPLPGRGGPSAAQLAPLAGAPGESGEPALKPPSSATGTGIFLQLGAFSSRDNAEGFRDTVAKELAAFAQSLELYADGGRFRLHAGPYASVDEARSAADRIAAVLKLKPFVVQR